MSCEFTTTAIVLLLTSAWRLLCLAAINSYPSYHCLDWIFLSVAFISSHVSVTAQAFSFSRIYPVPYCSLHYCSWVLRGGRWAQNTTLHPQLSLKSVHISFPTANIIKIHRLVRPVCTRNYCRCTYNAPLGCMYVAAVFFFLLLAIWDGAFLLDERSNAFIYFCPY